MRTDYKETKDKSVLTGNLLTTNLLGNTSDSKPVQTLTSQPANHRRRCWRSDQTVQNVAGTLDPLMIACL